MRKKLLIVALLLSFIYSLGGIYFHFFAGDEKEKVNSIDTIKGYDYTLKSSATELMKQEFSILKENLESTSVNKEKYAVSIAKLFIIDLYTMSNKLNKYDIGSADYVYKSAVASYKLNVTDTLYKYLEDNTNNKRKQTLPEVSSINLDEITESELKIDEKVYLGYKVKLSWEYVTDLEYDHEGEIIIVEDSDILYIAEKK
ncbi:MAG: hypothetical protein PHX04_02290 [Bacilli bacterium]|nr:hypothetical protein [Bacilli bacterium]